MKSYIISSSDVKYETNISMEDTPPRDRQELL